MWCLLKSNILSYLNQENKGNTKKPFFLLSFNNASVYAIIFLVLKVAKLFSINLLSATCFHSRRASQEIFVNSTAIGLKSENKTPVRINREAFGGEIITL